MLRLILLHIVKIVNDVFDYGEYLYTLFACVNFIYDVVRYLFGL